MPSSWADNRLDGAAYLTYTYDDASRLTSLTRGSAVFGFGYDIINRRTSMTYPNGVTTSYVYDDLSRLTHVGAKNLSPLQSITSFTYTYDNAGNRTRKAMLDIAEDYAYDDLYRLTGVDRSGALTRREHFGYDAVGNRLVTQVNDSVLSATYNERNQQLSSAAGGPLRVRGAIDEPGTVTVNGQPARMLSGNIFEATIQATPGLR
jgi:YD repeat-containing protein